MDFADGSFAWPEVRAAPEAESSRCPGCRVRLLFFEEVEVAALEACGLLHPRIAADRRRDAERARRAPEGALASVPADVIALVPRWVAYQWRCVPFADDGETLSLAMSAWSVGKVEERRLAGRLPRRPRAFAVPERDLVAALGRYYGYAAEEL